MIRRVTGLAQVFALLSASAARAQMAPPAPAALAIGEWQLSPVFDVRARSEYRRDLDDQNRGMLVERARLGVDALRGPVEVRVVMQDARSLNLAAATNVLEGPASQAVTGVYEGWAQAQTASLHPSLVRVGRQRVVWGEGRLLGAADWSAGGRTLDAVRARLALGNGAVEVLGAILEDTKETPVPTAYGELFGVRGEWTIDPLFALEAYVMARLAEANPTDSTSDLEGSVKGQTYAGAFRLWGDGEGWTWGAEVAYELGRVDVLAADRQAWAAAAHAARAFDTVLLTPTVQVGLAYASGDSAKAGGGTYRAFDPMLPDVHVWHGAMDVFAWSNEEEVSGRVSVVPFSDGAAALEYRYARLADAGGSWRSGYLATLGRSSGTSQELGHEIDASLGWSPCPNVDVGIGYSLLFLGDAARRIVGPSAAHLSHYAFAQASAKF